MDSGGAAVGIDFGTTNCAVALWRSHEGKAEVLQLDKDDESCILPSVVAFVGGDPVSVSGNEAVELRSRFPRCAVSNVKRFMGRKPMDPEVQDLVNLTAAQLQQSKGSEVRFSITRKDGNIASYGVLEVASLLFSHLRVQCKRVSGIDASRAVVTVPAYYTSNQRAVTRRAAEMAGFEVIRLIAEPTAASVAYGLDIGGDRRVLVADLGGGTFDVSILNVREGGTEVLVTEGDSMLGGEDFTTALVRHVLSGLDAAARGTIESSLPLLRRLHTKCESAKVALTTEKETVVELSAKRDPACRVPGFPLDHRVRVTRSDLERVAVPLLARMTTCVERAMEASELVDGVEEVVLVGGATRMPCVRDALWKVTGGIEQCVSLNPEHAVAEGAAISAALATGADPERLRDLLMLDALPRAIGLRDANGGVVVMLPRHTRLPAEHSEEFATATDDQEGVTVEVVEGEPEAGAGEVLELGSFNFPVHRPKGAQAGERRVKVTFSASEDGVVKVTGDPLGEDGEVVPPAQRDASARAKVTTAILLIYMVVLFVLYIAVKILLFQDTRLATHYGIDDAPREEL